VETPNRRQPVAGGSSQYQNDGMGARAPMPAETDLPARQVLEREANRRVALPHTAPR
jgi:hypothetical protein